MSVRIHQLAEKIGMHHNDLLNLLRSRGFEVKSVSSTIDNISAEAIEDEFSPTPVLKVSVASGFASQEEIADLLFEISKLHRMCGGSGITFTLEDVRVKEGVLI